LANVNNNLNKLAEGVTAVKFTIVGDGFVKNKIYEEVLQEYFPGAQFNGFEAPWPVQPFLDQKGEIKEYSGEPEDLIPLVAETEVLVVDAGPVTEAVLAAAPNLKAVSCTRGGPVNVNIPACTKRGIPVFNSPGRNFSAVVEFTLGLTLAHLKNITIGHHALKQGKWRGDLYLYEKVGPELPDIIVGVVGYGHIGREVARVFSMLGSEVLVYDPYVAAESVKRDGHRKVELDQLLQEADVVSLHARLTPETRKMIGEREFALMKPTAYFINTARGGLVDYEALYRALAGSKIKGAALDVYDPEPLPPDHPLLALENVTMTPHIGGASKTTVYRGVRMVAEDLKAYFSGQQVKYCVNAEVLPNNQ
jgi:D-3-phosphoglycerate dehydrogenase